MWVVSVVTSRSSARELWTTSLLLPAMRLQFVELTFANHVFAIRGGAVDVARSPYATGGRDLVRGAVLRTSGHSSCFSRPGIVFIGIDRPPAEMCLLERRTRPTRFCAGAVSPARHRA